MEWKIGEIKKVNGEWYQCIKQPEDFIVEVCKICAFQGTENCDIDECSDSFRSDKQDVIFKKLEKIGEPFYRRWTLEGNNKLMQRYKTYTTPLITIDKQQIFYNLTDDLLEIEIKQNKEVMEEKKQKLDDLVGLYTSAKITYKEFDEKLKTLYADKEECKSSLKEFDLEAAKAGKPVCTRDGRKARIICFDLQSIEKTLIVAAVQVTDKQEVIANYYENGRQFINGISELDLMMLPEKKEGWVNVRRLKSPGDNDIPYVSTLYPTKEEAITNANLDVIDTIKVSWEE